MLFHVFFRDSKLRRLCYKPVILHVQYTSRDSAIQRVYLRNASNTLHLNELFTIALHCIKFRVQSPSTTHNARVR